MDNKNKGKILVIGATGTVGSEVLKRLVSTPSDNSIRAAVHSRNRADEISRQYTNKGIEIVDLDYMQPETITNALIDINRLFLQTLPVPDAINICSNIIREAKNVLTSSCIYAEFYNSVWSNNKDPKCILCSCWKCKDEFCGY